MEWTITWLAWSDDLHFHQEFPDFLFSQRHALYFCGRKTKPIELFCFGIVL
mgnify:CR=1 FL=1